MLVKNPKNMSIPENCTLHSQYHENYYQNESNSNHNNAEYARDKKYYKNFVNSILIGKSPDSNVNHLQSQIQIMILQNYFNPNLIFSNITFSCYRETQKISTISTIPQTNTNFPNIGTGLSIFKP